VPEQILETRAIEWCAVEQCGCDLELGAVTALAIN